MNVAQQRLVDLTLRIIGWLAVVLAGVPLLWGAFTVRYFWDDLFDAGSPAVLLIPVFVAGIICLWVRAFLRAGRAS